MGTIDFNRFIIVIDKPAGPTSFQVTDFVRKQLGLNKAAHCGTLDPEVTGVLPILLGRASRLLDYFIHRDKEYTGIMHMHEPVEKEKIEQVIKQKFLGKIKQLPPIRSRVKREEREREIKKFDILEQDDKDFLFRVECEAGTYIRKLCLPKNTEIIVDGSLRRISKVVEEGLVDQKTLSFKDFYFKEFKISNQQKIKAPDKIVNIETESGIPLRVTEDHKILVLKKNKGEYVEASKIKKGDKIISVKKIDIFPKKFAILDSLDDDMFVNGPEIKEECVKLLNKKFTSIREVARRFQIDRKQFNMHNNIWLRKKYLKLTNRWLYLKNFIKEIKTEKGIKFDINSFQFDKNLSYILGLIASDGCVVFEKKNIRPTRIKFHNKEIALINRFVEVYKTKFPNFKCKIRKVKNKLIEIDAYNPILANICYSLGIISPQSKSDFVKIFELEEDIIASFLKGYFDGDGSAFFKTKKSGAYSNIEYATSHFISAKRIFILLKRLGINSRIFKRISSSGFDNKKHSIFIIRLKGIVDKKEFIKKIGTNHPGKKGYLDKIKEYFKKKKIREKNYIYEKVKNISVAKFNEEFVYDITVDKSHNFLAEGNFVVSNCHDLGIELGIGAHMTELRRTCASIFYEKESINLYQFTEAVKEYNDGKPEKLKSMLKPIETITKVLPKIEIKKEHIDKILHGSPIFSEMIQEYENFNKNDFIALMHNKKLLGIAQTEISSSEIKKSNLVAKPKTIFN